MDEQYSVWNKDILFGIFSEINRDFPKNRYITVTVGKTAGGDAVERQRPRRKGDARSA